jgi:hypothetical protein
VGSEPGSSQFHLFSHFHHFTAEPQRLPLFGRYRGRVNKRFKISGRGYICTYVGVG